MRMLDGALVYSDDDLIQRMFDALHRQAHDKADHRPLLPLASLQKLGGNVFQITDWQL
jgi:hypothetical protein